MSEHTPEQKATEIWDKICEFSFQKGADFWGKDYSEYIRNNEPTKITSPESNRGRTRGAFATATNRATI